MPKKTEKSSSRLWIFIAAPVSVNPTRYVNTFPQGDKESKTYYELENQMCEKINKTFSEKYPEIYQGLLTIIPGLYRFGAKNDRAIYIHGDLKKN